MWIGLDEEQIFLQKSFGELLVKECPTTLVRRLRDEVRDEAGAPGGDPRTTTLWSALAGAGVFGLALPAELGGEGGDLFDLGLVHEQAGRVLCPTAVYSTVAFGVALARLAPPEQAAALLAPVLSGSAVAAVVLGDPGDPTATTPTVRARRHVDGGWTLDGQLRFVPNGDVADALLIVATTADEPGKLLGVVLDPATAGVTQRRMRTFAGDVQTVVHLDGVVVSDPARILGDDAAGLGAGAVAATRNALTALLCAEMVGGASAVLDRTVEHVLTRHQFSRPLGGFQAVQHMVADMHIALDGARATAYQALWWTARGRTAEREVAIAKLRANAAYKDATLTAHQLHGGMGYLRETDLHLWSERAKAAELLDGGTDIALERIARARGLVA